MRRILLSVLGLTLALLAPGPVSLCAELMQLCVDCAPPPPKTHCEAMAAAMSEGATMRAGMGECCALTRTPNPQGTVALNKVELVVIPIEVPIEPRAYDQEASRFERHSVFSPFEHSPPNLLALHCCLLI